MDVNLGEMLLIRKFRASSTMMMVDWEGKQNFEEGRDLKVSKEKRWKEQSVLAWLIINESAHSFVITINIRH